MGAPSICLEEQRCELGFRWSRNGTRLYLGADLSGAIEILGSGSIFNHKFVALIQHTFEVFLLPGAFVTVGILIAGMNIISARLRKAS